MRDLPVMSEAAVGRGAGVTSALAGQVLALVTDERGQ
jgi:hypothetical protein